MSRAISRRHLLVRNLAFGVVVIAAYPTEGLAQEDVLVDAAPILAFLPLAALVLLSATGGLRGFRGRMIGRAPWVPISADRA